MKRGLVAEVRMTVANLARSGSVQMYCRVGSIEEWGFVDQRDLQNFKDGMVCMTCQHSIYGVDQH